MIEIKTGNIPCYVYVSDVFNHTHFKSIILNSIKNYGIFGMYTGERDLDQSIFNTDWHLSDNLHSKNTEYSCIINNIIFNHNKALSHFLRYEDPINCGNIWFQQYRKNDFHGWHRHKRSVFSNVYYVDLPNNAIKTSFRLLGKEFSVEVKEGQILTFPSFIEHCSKPNLFNNIKTVISFNSN